VATPLTLAGASKRARDASPKDAAICGEGKAAGDFGVCLLLHDLLQSVCMGRSEHGLRDLEVEAHGFLQHTGVRG